MIKTFPIDIIREVIEKTLEIEHIKDIRYPVNYREPYFGGKDQVNLFSFYEQLQKEDEVDRYVNMYRDLTDQQNRTGLIMNGTIIAPENPTITNLYQVDIIPMTFTCSFRVKIKDRDTAVQTINNLIGKLKGKKKDVALLNGVTPFMVGTIGNGDDTPHFEKYDFVGMANEEELDEDISAKVNSVGFSTLDFDFCYYEDEQTDLLCAAGIKTLGGQWEKIDEDTAAEDMPYGVILPPTHTSYEKYCVSISCDSIRCDEPKTLNSDEYCVISFGGSATITSDNVILGNELVKVGMKKDKIVGSPNITINGYYEWLEPLELPSGNNAETRVNRLVSNKFLNNTHTDGLDVSLQYTFILNKDITLLKQLFSYGRYGTQGTSTSNYSDGVSPNMIYEIKEIWSSWGNVDIRTFKAKVVESIDIENTESDVLSITIPLQIQGENN